MSIEEPVGLKLSILRGPTSGRKIPPKGKKWLNASTSASRNVLERYSSVQQHSNNNSFLNSSLSPYGMKGRKQSNSIDDPDNQN